LRGEYRGEKKKIWSTFSQRKSLRKKCPPKALAARNPYLYVSKPDRVLEGLERRDKKNVKEGEKN